MKLTLTPSDFMNVKLEVNNIQLSPNGIEVGDSISFNYTKMGAITFREIDEVLEVFYSRDGSYTTHATCMTKGGHIKKFIADKISNLRLL